MYLFGWTMRQFAAAKDHYEKVTGEKITPTVKNAHMLSEWWRNRRDDNPLDFQLCDVKPKLDLQWSFDVFTSAY